MVDLFFCRDTVRGILNMNLMSSAFFIV